MNHTGAETPGTLRWHAARTLRLALPVMLSRAGILLLVVVDTTMTGHAGAEQLAYYGIGIALQIAMYLIGVGSLLGTVVLTALAHGANRDADCGRIWRVALAHAAGYGLLMLMLSSFGENLLLLFGQSPALARGGGSVMLLFGWSLPGMLMFIATTLFLEGIDRPLPGMLVMLAANLLNVLLNWLLIYGNGGLPALGADGAALATTLVRWFMCFAIVGYVLLRIDPVRYGIGGRRAGPAAGLGYGPGPGLGLGRRLRRIGYPMALSQGLESSAFATMTMFAGWLGPLQVAAFQATLSLIALVFMFALGFSTAASVRVANAVGRGDPAGARRAGWVAAALVTLVLGLWSLLFHSVPESLAAFYTNDPEVAAAIIAAVSVAALALVPDGFQAVLMGALRGLSDVWPATLIFLFSFWLVMVPAGYLIGVNRNHGAAGLVGAILLGCLCATLLLALRFHYAARPGGATPAASVAT